MRVLVSIAAVLLLLSFGAFAQTYTVLHSFKVEDGTQPYAGLIQGLDGSLYGTTSDNDLGAQYHGTLFKITPDGTFTKLHTFNGLGDGGRVFAGLTLVPDGSLFGVTNGGGFTAAGTVFKFSQGVLTTLHVFDRDIADFPFGGLLLAADGNLYGTTTDEGDKQATAGTIYRITQDGSFTVLYNFVYDSDDGWDPQSALVQNRGGALYGTTPRSANNQGTIFKFDKTGKLTTVYHFCTDSEACPDGAGPVAALVQGPEGALYGTTPYGGSTSCEPAQLCGTVYKLTASGLTTVHTFQGNDGADSVAPLYVATDGNLYGTAAGGGTDDPACYQGCGTVFRVTAAGVFSTLYSFCQTAGCPDGFGPTSPLVQATDGDFYGTTLNGGGSNEGVVYKLSLGLPPFVKLLPAVGITGQSIRVLGNNLLGTTGVTFNGTPAEFIVNTNSFLTAKVPAGATSGAVQVTTSNGVLSSNITFHVNR